MTDFRTQTVSANGQSFHTLEWGDKKKPLVLFLHGFPGYSGMWRDYVKDLGSDYYAVAPDLRGYNLSSKPKNLDDYLIPSLVEDIKSLVTALGHKQAFLVSHDWGGILAWHTIAKYPEVFTKAVIMNGPHPRIYADLYASDPVQKTMSIYVKIFHLPGIWHLLKIKNFLILRKSIFDASKKTFTEEEKRGYLEAWRRGLQYPIYYYKANTVDMEKHFKNIPPTDVPTLVLWGERDINLSKKNLEGLEEWASKLTIKRYPDATHWIPHEKTQEVLKDIRGFFG